MIIAAPSPSPLTLGAYRLVTPHAPRREERCSAGCHRTGLGTTRCMIYRCLALVGCIAQVAAFGSVPGGGGDNGGSPSPP
eukprot:1559353-Pleurochrysis_carterae.AAC.1